MAKSGKETDQSVSIEDGVVGSTGRRWRILAIEAVPKTPEDREEVRKQAAGVTRRFPEASWAEGVNGLKEVASRGRSQPGELGDLVPPTEKAAQTATVLERTRAVILRLKAQLEYHQSVLALEEHEGNLLIDEYEQEASRRIAKGRIEPDAYDNLRKFVGARGETISLGIAQSKALQKARAEAKPADDDKA